MTYARLFALAVLAAGCDSTAIQPGVFDPFDTSRAFSVYAVLDADTLDHTIRVQTIRRESDPPQSADEARLSAPTVYTVDGATGDSLRWAQSTEPLGDGSFATFYSARFDPAVLRSYELVLLRNDGRSARGRAAVPDVDLSPGGDEPRDRDGAVVQSVTWAAFGSLRGATATVSFELDPDQERPSSLLVGAEVDTAPGAEPIVTVDYSAAAVAVREAFGLDADAPLYLLGMRVEANGTSPGWESAGGDPVQAAESGNLDGAVGRFGFVGTGATFLRPPEEWVRRAGFLPPL